MGLQLSFASTTGIVFFAGGLYRSLSENRLLAHLLRKKTACSALLRAMLTALCCTISSMVFALPITAIQFGTVSLAAPVVNVMALWMLSIVFCGGMLTALLALALPAAAGVCAWALSWPVRLVLLIVRGAAKLPFAALYLENGYLIAAAVFLTMDLRCCFRCARKPSGSGRLLPQLCSSRRAAWGFPARIMRCRAAAFPCSPRRRPSRPTRRGHPRRKGTC